MIVILGKVPGEYVVAPWCGDAKIVNIIISTNNSNMPYPISISLNQDNINKKER